MNIYFFLYVFVMTGQWHDTCLYAGNRWDVAGIRGQILPKPDHYGMYCFSSSAACSCGYLRIFTIQYHTLRLMSLFLNQQDPRPINGVTPAPRKAVSAGNSREYLKRETFFTHHYHKLDLLCAFTGTLLLGEDLLEGQTIREGYQDPTAYAQVVECVFRDGTLTSSTEISSRMAAMRRTNTLMRTSGWADELWGERDLYPTFDVDIIPRGQRP